MENYTYSIQYESGSDILVIPNHSATEVGKLVRQWRDSNECQELCMDLVDYLRLRGIEARYLTVDATIDGYGGHII